MIQHGGFWYPDGDVTFHLFHPAEAARDIPWFLKNVQGRGTVVQAGANIGTYPLALADHFQRVITFEPDPHSWECLQANLKARDCHRRVEAHNGALAQNSGEGQMVDAIPGNWGARRVAGCDGGPIDVWKLDSFALTECDALWLDIEGCELFALQGAEQIIRTFSPVLVLEENGNGAKYGVDEFGIADYLETLGYEREAGIGRDRLYRRTNG